MTDTTLDTIALRNLRFYTHIGCTAEERHVGQHIEMDVVFHLDLGRAGTTDDITTSIDYAEAAARIRDAVSGHEANLLETIAQRAADAALGIGAPRVTVRVRKPSPPMPGTHADHAEITITRAR